MYNLKLKQIEGVTPGNIIVVGQNGNLTEQVSVAQILWADLVNLQIANSMVPGFYHITDAQIADGGVIVQAVSTDRLALNATGIFYNADYAGVGIYTDVITQTGIAAGIQLGTWTTETGSVGIDFDTIVNGPLSVGDLITDDTTGATGYVTSVAGIPSNYFMVWRTSAALFGIGSYTSNAGATFNAVNTPDPTSPLGNIAIRSNIHYQVTDISLYDLTSPDLNPAYTLITARTLTTGYIEVSDYIDYDLTYAGGYILSRKDNVGNEFYGYMANSGYTNFKWGDPSAVNNNIIYGIVYNSNNLGYLIGTNVSHGSSVNLQDITSSISNIDYQTEVVHDISTSIKWNGNLATSRITGDNETLALSTVNIESTYAGSIDFTTDAVHTEGGTEFSRSADNAYTSLFHEVSDTILNTTITVFNGTAAIEFTVAEPGITITDNINNVGMSYTADYSSVNITNGNDRWLVDKGYVDGLVVNGSNLTNITYASIFALQQSNTLVPKFYNITDRADGGIIVEAVSTDRLSINATGIFYEPDYFGTGTYTGIEAQTGVAFTGVDPEVIWNPRIGQAIVEYDSILNGPFVEGDLITDDITGAQGYIYVVTATQLYIWRITEGINFGIGNYTAGNGATANVWQVTVDPNNLGLVSSYLGIQYQVTNIAAWSNVQPGNGNGAFTALGFAEDKGYHKYSDAITYNLVEDIITSRLDKVGNHYFGSEFTGFRWGSQSNVYGNKIYGNVTNIELGGSTYANNFVGKGVTVTSAHTGAVVVNNTFTANDDHATTVTLGPIGILNEFKFNIINVSENYSFDNATDYVRKEIGFGKSTFSEIVDITGLTSIPISTLFNYVGEIVLQTTNDTESITDFDYFPINQPVRITVANTGFIPKVITFVHGIGVNKPYMFGTNNATIISNGEWIEFTRDADTGYIMQTGIGKYESIGSNATGSGTTNFLSKWTGSTTLGDSLVSDDGVDVTVSSLAGTNDRVVQADTNGIITATKEIINGFGITNTDQLLLEDIANWTGTVYTGTALTALQGQMHADLTYLFLMITDGYPIRIALV